MSILCYIKIRHIICSTEMWLESRLKIDMISIQGMTVFRKDRNKDIRDNNAHVIDGDACSCVQLKWCRYIKYFEYGSRTSVENEILTLVLDTPNFRKPVLICL